MEYLSSMFVLRVLLGSAKLTFEDVGGFATALHGYINNVVSQDWGVNMAVYASRILTPRPGEMRLYLHDRPDTPSAPAQHIWGTDGDPEGTVYVGLCTDWGLPWTRAASHEAIEMVLDPWVNRYIWAAGHAWAHEVCDPVSEHDVPVETYAMSNYVLPAYYREGGKGPYDHLGKLTAPLSFSPKGYLQRIENGILRTVYGVSSPLNPQGHTAKPRKDRRLCS